MSAARAVRPIAWLLPLLGALAAAAAEPGSGYVGAAACAPCHPAQTTHWRGSHHDQAMQPATAQTVRGDFDGATFTKDGVTTTFTRRDGTYVVRTDGPDGALHDYRVAYVFGVEPLQQYLLELPGGRLQALSIAWDTRPRADGGQRWYALYPDETIDHRDVLHWTGPMQNWNHMCAACHSTALDKGYRGGGQRFATTWAALNVSCEACHGPGAAHLRWAEAAPRTPARAPAATGAAARGLTVALPRGRWQFAPGARIAHRVGGPPAGLEVDTCGRCHARQAQLAADRDAGTPLADARQVALLDEGLYHPDGQIRDEVYEYGSFLQSRMARAGVVCSDCHEPHSLQLRAPGNALCAQCHLPAAYDTPAHHHHAPDTPGAACGSCHMIARTYMGIDVRHDHSFRIPRPDLGAALGAPDACTDCHTDRPQAWAAEAIASWRPTAARPWHYGIALHAGRSARPDAERQLLRAAGDPAVPAIARATAVSLLAPYLSPRSLPVLRQAVADRDPLVRRAGADTAAALEPRARVALLRPLLDDPMLSVRLAAVSALLDVPPSAYGATPPAALARARDEYRAVQRFNADRAEAWSNLGTLERATGDAAAAHTAFTRAIQLEPSFVPAAVNLADLQRAVGREAEAEATLRQALTLSPDAASLHHALGLSLVRQQRLPEARAALQRATELDPDRSRYAYVYAVALHGAGDLPGAIAVLEAAHARRPAERDVIVALAEYSAAAGDRDAVRRWQATLRALDAPR